MGSICLGESNDYETNEDDEAGVVQADALFDDNQLAKDDSWMAIEKL